MNRQRIPSSRIRLVITGGIGSGKSTVAARLSELGADVIRADDIGHEVLEPGGAAYAAVAERWPNVVHDGRIDRRALARIVFSAASELRVLESLTHPAIAREIARRVADAASRVVAVEVPIGIDLVGLDGICVLVEAPEEERVRRAVAGGYDEEDVRRRVAVQPDSGECRSRADYVIVNDGTKEQLRAAVDGLWERLIDGRDGNACSLRRAD